VVGSGLDEALKYLLVNVIETFFQLTGEDAEEYRRLVSRKEYRAVQEVELTWADKLMEKGREAGREEGVVEGMRRTLLRQLAAKFGNVSDPVVGRVQSMSEVELESTLDRVLTAATLDELKLGD
jgi:predicted transposase YdaD